MDKPPRFGVIGHPIEHSRSPQIHLAFADQHGITLDYQRIDADVGHFTRAVEAFGSAYGRGLNVTLPHKFAAYALSQRLSARAQLAGAVNTLSWSEGLLLGDNTDGIGLWRDLLRLARAQGRDLIDQRFLFLGAGGATRGAIAGLIEQGVMRISVAARNEVAARELTERFVDHRAVSVQTVLLSDRHARFDIVVNGTSAGVTGDVPEMALPWLQQAWLAYDLSYRAPGAVDTAFLRFAQQAGALRCEDGLGMLVEQAAESFFVWHGLVPDVAPVLALLRGR